MMPKPMRIEGSPFPRYMILINIVIRRDKASYGLVELTSS